MYRIFHDFVVKPLSSFILNDHLMNEVEEDEEEEQQRQKEEDVDVEPHLDLALTVMKRPEPTAPLAKRHVNGDFRSTEATEASKNSPQDTMAAIITPQRHDDNINNDHVPANTPTTMTRQDPAIMRDTTPPTSHAASQPDLYVIQQSLEQSFTSFQQLLVAVETMGMAFQQPTGVATTTFAYHPQQHQQQQQQLLSSTKLEQFHSFQKALADLQAEGASLKELLRQLPLPNDIFMTMMKGANNDWLSPMAIETDVQHPSDLAPIWKSLEKLDHRCKEYVRSLPASFHNGEGRQAFSGQRPSTLENESIAKRLSYDNDNHPLQPDNCDDQVDRKRPLQSALSETQEKKRRTPVRSIGFDNHFSASEAVKRKPIHSSHEPNQIKAPPPSSKDISAPTTTKRPKIIFEDSDSEEDDNDATRTMPTVTPSTIWESNR